MLKITVLKKIVLIGIIINVFFLAYFLTFHQYFQQDEWHNFGLQLALKLRFITLDKNLFELLLGDRVGARILSTVLFSSFGLNSHLFGLFALTIHLANTFLVYLTTKKLTNTPIIGIFAAFFFLINEVGNEGYSWFGTMSGTATSVFFFLLSTLSFIKFIDTKQIKFSIFSALLLWVSFLFKEIAAFAFLFYPLLFFIYKKSSDDIKEFIKSYSPFIVLAAIMLIFFAKTALFIPGDKANYVSGGNNIALNIAINSIRYPLEGTFQALVPNAFLFKLSDITTRIISPKLSPESLDFLVASQNSSAEITIVFLLIFGIVSLALILNRNWKTLDAFSKKTLLTSALITFLSFLPYAVINRSFSYLDSRHYYLATVGASIFIATLIVNFINKKSIYSVIFLSVAILYILIHQSILIEDFNLFKDRSYERRLFLKQIETTIPTIPDKTVFYITGDSEGYYGLPELKVPFQSGMGHVLMVIYTKKGQLSPNFFDENPWTKALDVGFLYDTLGQGYREVKGKGFGYYHDELELKKAIDKKMFSKNDIIYLHYNHEEKKLTRKNFE